MKYNFRKCGIFVLACFPTGCPIQTRPEAATGVEGLSFGPRLVPCMAERYRHPAVACSSRGVDIGWHHGRVPDGEKCFQKAVYGERHQRKCRTANASAYVIPSCNCCVVGQALGHVMFLHAQQMGSMLWSHGQEVGERMTIPMRKAPARLCAVAG